MLISRAGTAWVKQARERKFSMLQFRSAGLALALVSSLALTGVAAAQPQDRWHAEGRALYEAAIAVPTVKGRGNVVELAKLLKAKFDAAGLAADIRPHDGTAALVVHWRAEKPRAKPIIILAHMDVVEALPSDWSLPPFKLTEQDGYFYGRGTSDDKQGVIAVTTALLRLKAQGFKPKRDIVVLFTGDEETDGRGAERAMREWRADFAGADYALNADAGGGSFLKDGTPLGFGLQTSEKTFQSFSFTARNPGGHSSRPRPDNAIYDLSAALLRLKEHRFTPMMNETTRGYFTERAKQEKGRLGDAMRAWLANPADGAAADAIEADPLEVGLTRTRCVATLLEGGHADNALPQTARGVVNCRIFPGVSVDAVRAELAEVAGPGVDVAAWGDTATPAAASPLRADLVSAYTAVVRARHPSSPIIPQMSTGATDGASFRAGGIPVYGVDGAWGLSPEDERAHGKDERLPVKAFYDNLDHWHDLIARLAG